jgi:hypothetical protein
LDHRLTAAICVSTIGVGRLPPLGCGTRCVDGVTAWADRKFVLATVAQSGGALEDASAELKGDREVVMAAVTLAQLFR